MVDVEFVELFERVSFSWYEDETTRWEMSMVDALESHMDDMATEMNLWLRYFFEVFFIRKFDMLVMLILIPIHFEKGQFK